MRRSTRDSGSQPLRNHAQYPGFEATSGTVTVRTNHAPCPRMTASLGGYGSQTITSVTGLSGHPDGITTAQRVSYTAGASNPGAFIYSGNLDSSTQYTFRAWVYNEGPATENLAFALQSVTSGGSQGVVPGVWTLLEWTYTTPANTNTSFGVRIASPTNTGSFLITGIIIEKLPASGGPFFDGATTNAGDFTYSWNGTANASTSKQTAPGVLGVGSVPAQAIPYSSTDRPASGTRFCRWMLTTGATAIGFNLTDVTLGFPSNSARTCGLWARASTAMTVIPRLRRNDGAVTLSVGGGIVLTPNVWTKITVTGAWATTAESFGLLMNTGSGQTVGATLDIDMHWTYEGASVPTDYIDGGTPFGKWDGAAGASTSIAYPPQLLDIAGKPDLDLVGAASTGGVAIPVDPFAPRTFYVIYESTGYTSAYQNCFRYGVTPTKGFILQTAGANSSAMSNRFDFPGGSVNGSITLSSGRIPRRHVAALAFEQGLTTVRACLNGAADVIGNPTPGTGWDDGRADTTINATEIKNVRALVYYADHDRDTRLAISRYLGAKYGASIL